MGRVRIYGADGEFVAERTLGFRGEMVQREGVEVVREDEVLRLPEAKAVRAEGEERMDGPWAGRGD